MKNPAHQHCTNRNSTDPEQYPNNKWYHNSWKPFLATVVLRSYLVKLLNIHPLTEHIANGNLQNPWIGLHGTLFSKNNPLKLNRKGNPKKLFINKNQIQIQKIINNNKIIKNSSTKLKLLYKK
jgi:hypothetical protein